MKDTTQLLVITINNKFTLHDQSLSSGITITLKVLNNSNHIADEIVYYIICIKFEISSTTEIQSLNTFTLIHIYIYIFIYMTYHVITSLKTSLSVKVKCKIRLPSRS